MMDYIHGTKQFKKSHGMHVSHFSRKCVDQTTYTPSSYRSMHFGYRIRNTKWFNRLKPTHPYGNSLGNYIFHLTYKPYGFLLLVHKR